MEMALCWVLAFITRDFPFNSDGWDLISTFNKKKKLTAAHWVAGCWFDVIVCIINKPFMVLGKGDERNHFILGGFIPS